MTRRNENAATAGAHKSHNAEHQQICADHGVETWRCGHTPGPWWNYPEESDGRMKGFIRDGKGVAVCKVNNTGRDYDEYHANARLIAAAPELLEACKDIVTCTEKDGRVFIPANGATMTMLRAAIAKAERKA